MRQVTRTLTAADHRWVVGHRVLICDRDAKWSAPVRVRPGEAGIRVVQTPFQAPSGNAYAERFVRSIKHGCLNRVIPFGDRQGASLGARRGCVWCPSALGRSDAPQFRV